MRKYYKCLALLLILSMALTILAGCKKEEEQTSAGTISDFESQAHFQPGTSGDDHSSGDTSKAPVSGEFVVSDKKYDYNGANLELLYVENQTDRHYNVTIKGKYLDENGETIKEEAQTFMAFPAGWSNNFIFYPKIAFDSFAFELEMEEYTSEALRADQDGNPLASYIELTYEKNLVWQRGVAGGDENGHSIEVRELLFYASLTNSHSSVKIGVDFHVILLDTQGEIYLTDYDYSEGGISGTAAGPVGSEASIMRTTVPLVRQEPGQDETIPENVQGVFTAVFSYIDVFDRQLQLNQ